MADCPGFLHLADMADGGLARLRAPGGALSARQARGVADAAERLGSGEIDLTNRANLQLRGLAMDAGPALVAMLAEAGLRFHGDADRRRNILLDPFSGIDPSEMRDLRPLAAALDEALTRAPWIGRMSPKFSFALDGGGESHVGAVASDVVIRAEADGLTVAVGEFCVTAPDGSLALRAALAVAEVASAEGPDARASGLDVPALTAALGEAGPLRRVEAAPPLRPRFGAVAARDGSVALAFPVPVGRIDAAMLRVLADMADAEGEGRLVLAPWSAAVLPGARPDRTEALLARAERAGFPPVAVARRIAVIACAGAPACARATEPAKQIARDVLTLAAAEPDRLPASRRSLHLSACAKGCAGSASADLLLLGRSGASGWSVHENGAPRSPGPERGAMERPDAAGLLARLAGIPGKNALR